MRLTITGYSTALFSTWFFIEELGLLFDAGDGLMAGLLQKSRKIKHVFISHADRDHLMGLFQFNQLNAREGGFPIIHYPKDSGSFPAIASFVQKFDPHVPSATWLPLSEGQLIEIKSNVFVEAIKNGHIIANPALTKSLSFHVYEKRRKLKPAFKSASGEEVRQAIAKHGQDYVTDSIQSPIISYSGDTPLESDGRWQNSRILIHEATFLYKNSDDGTESSRNKHSTLEEVIEMVADTQVEKLILSHFSSRYSKEQIDVAILELCQKYKLKIPVYRVLPGEIARDILNQEPILTL